MTNFKSPFALLILVLVSSSKFVDGQTPPPDFYRSTSGRIRSREETEMVRSAYYHQKQLEAQFEEMRNLPMNRPQASAADVAKEKQRKKALDALMKPTASELSSFGKILAGRNGGIFTLLSRDFCRKDFENDDPMKNVCLAPPPGRGERFSFRRQDYSHPFLSDIGLFNGWFVGFGLATQTIFTDLGNVPIADVEPNRPDLRFLTEFSPATTIEGLESQREDLEAGVAQDGNVFFNAVRANVDHTYVMRTIAYRGKSLIVIDLGERKLEFDRLKEDPRKDRTVVFRVLRGSEDDRLRIIWRSLQSRESPVLDLPVIRVDGSQVRTVIRKVN